MGSNDLSKLGFVKTFVLPALLIFLVPCLALAFFLHAQSLYDAQMREAYIEQFRGDPELTPAEREDAIAFFTEHPTSELLLDDEFAAQFDGRLIFEYAAFRWAIRLSAYSILSGMAIFLVAGACVALSRRSQRAQYWSLRVGWHVLRIYAALQTAVQGVLLVALSYWVTAVWFHIYVPKLIFIAAVLTLGGVAAVVKAIFKRPNAECAVEGKVLDQSEAPEFWNALNAICARVGTAPPDQVIVGIDDNFFVTELPVRVNDVVYRGRTLFVSLSLLKQMNGSEAVGVLVHEMAHFAGQDTLYTKKTAPLLARYANYLQALYENPIARPTFYFMHCFRALFELSLSEHSRQREFRADRVAAELSSPDAFASALLRIAAYSDFRGNVQGELFQQDAAMPTADVSARIEQGFHDYAASFASKPDIGALTLSHPFDSHPPLTERLSALGVSLDSHAVQRSVATPGDGRWYGTIDNAEQLERQQWDRFEEQFRQFHELSLPYRFLPETEEERAIVEQAFPALAIEGKKGHLLLDCETLHFTAWSGPLSFSEVTNISLQDAKLLVHCDRSGKHKESIPLKTFGKRQQEALDAIANYYARYTSAVEYQQAKHSQDEQAGSEE